jgi:hypothetical protein
LFEVPKVIDFAARIVHLGVASPTREDKLYVPGAGVSGTGETPEIMVITHIQARQL